jgi:hypothetical protein
MPKARIDRDISLDEAESILTRELSPTYQVKRSSQGFTVKRSGLLWANVRASYTDGGTTFTVHGGGVILNRIYAEMGLARKVAQVLNRSLGSAARTG